MPSTRGSGNKPVFHYDQWENSEAVAYIQERTVFVMIVLSSRSRAYFRRSWDDFPFAGAELSVLDG